MKRMLWGFSILLLVVISCKGKPDQASGKNEKAPSENTSPKEALQPVIEDYLLLTSALVDNSGEDAAKSGKKLLTTLKEFDNPAIAAKGTEDFKDIMDDAEVNAQHISANADHIFHQREHLDFLSRDINDLVEMFGTSQKLYRIFCQDYNENKGAYWISDSKTVNNPYGSDYESCGSVQKEYEK